jgi:hypothetical protein
LTSDILATYYYKYLKFGNCYESKNSKHFFPPLKSLKFASDKGYGDFNKSNPSWKNWLNASLGLVATSAIALSYIPEAKALSFTFGFDNTSDGTVTPPFVGSGTFSFDGDPGDGQFALTSLTNYSFNFSFGADTFTNANITTPIADIIVAIATNGSDRIVNFGGSGGGPNGGSIDFENLSNTSQSFLSFQPNFGSLYFTSSYFGTYAGVVTPDAVPFEFSPGLGMVLLGSWIGFCQVKKHWKNKDDIS